MSLDTIFIGSLCIGIAIFVIAAASLRMLKSDDRSKIVVDTLMKTSIVIIGVALGVFTFLTQKVSEQAVSDLTDANDALIGLDTFISLYDSAVADARIDDDTDDGFPEIVKACQPFKNTCDRGGRSSLSMKAGTAQDMNTYLGSPYLEKFEPNFVEFALQKPSLRKTIYPDEITSANENQIWIVQEHDAIKEELLETSKEMAGCTEFFGDRDKEANITARDNPKCFNAAVEACCSILDINDHSLSIAKYGTMQHANMCKVRTDLAEAVTKLLDGSIVPRVLNEEATDLKRRVRSLVGSSPEQALSTCGAAVE